MAPHLLILAPRARPALMREAESASPDYGVSDQPDWRGVPWGSHLRAMTVEARRVHLAELGSGDGPPILLIHGLGGRWQHWLENLPRLARQRRVVAVDLPGFGRSQLPVEPITIAGYARILDRVCDLLEIDRAVVVGNSLGGLVATELAIRIPARVERLVLVAAASLTPAQISPGASKLALTALGRLTGALPRGVNRSLTRPRARHLAFAAVVRHPTRIAADMLYELAGTTRQAATFAALGALGAHDVRDGLATISVPTLVTQGRNDMLVPWRDAERLAELIPNAELVIFEDTGHLPMVERPVAFNDALLRFIGEPVPAREPARTPADG